MAGHRVRVKSVPPTKRRKRDEPLSLYPMTPEIALRRALNTLRPRHPVLGLRRGHRLALGPEDSEGKALPPLVPQEVAAPQSLVLVCHPDNFRRIRGES